MPDDNGWIYVCWRDSLFSFHLQNIFLRPRIGVKNSKVVWTRAESLTRLKYMLSIAFILITINLNIWNFEFLLPWHVRHQSWGEQENTPNICWLGSPVVLGRPQLWQEPHQPDVVLAHQKCDHLSFHSISSVNWKTTWLEDRYLGHTSSYFSSGVDILSSGFVSRPTAAPRW